MKALVGSFNKEKALVGALSMIVKSSRTFISSSIGAVQEVEITVMLQFHRTAAAAISSNQDYEGLGQRIEGGEGVIRCGAATGDR